jgi:formylglycine-generating enzyme required for sulfatase activity
MSASIFISFASNDRKAAETICTALENRGLECWIATRNIGPGENFQESITRAIRTAKVMILVFSANANNSLEVKKEIALAGRYNVVVVPVRVEDVAPNDALSYELAVRQWIDLFDDWEHAIEHLTTQVTALVAASASDPAATQDPVTPPTPVRPNAVSPPRVRRSTPTNHGKMLLPIAGAAVVVVLLGGGIAWNFWPADRSHPSSSEARVTQPLPAPTEPAAPAAPGVALAPPQPKPENAPSPSSPAAPQSAASVPAPAPMPQASSAAPVAPSAGETFRDCSNCPQMVVLPAGRFAMGGDVGEQPRGPLVPETHAEPVHEVTFAKPFAFGKFDITRAEFAAFASATNFTAHPCGRLAGNGWVHEERTSWQNPGFSQTERDPVVCVNANDIDAYLGWLRTTTGKPYRLPSEAEWEYAARAGTATSFYWGNDFADVCAYENVADESFRERFRVIRQIAPCRDGFVETSPVGSFKPNRWGLFDMIGNIFVLTEDCWNETYAGAPTDGSAWKIGDCSRRAARKASFGNGWPLTFRTDFRHSDASGPRRARWGFRVALSLP